MSGQRMQILLACAMMFVLVLIGWLGWRVVHKILQGPDVLTQIPAGTVRMTVLAETPLQILQDSSYSTADLRNWASRWQSSSVDSPLDSEEDLIRLQKSIENGDVPAIAQLRIAKIAMDMHDDDTAAIWARSGVYRAEQELGDLPADDPNVKAILDALKPLERPLTKQQDPATLEKYWWLLMRIPRGGDSDVQADWRRISHAGWLAYLGRYDEALSEINEIRTDPTAKYLVPEQRDEMAWLEALARFKSGDVRAASPMLASVKNNSKNPHARDAAILLKQIDTPKTVLALLRGHKTNLDKLEKWAERWEATDSGSRPNSRDELNELKKLIEASDLGAGERLSIGQIIEQAGDLKSAVLWYEEGIEQTKIELAAAQTNRNASSAAVQTLTPLLSGLDAAKALFWKMPERGPWEQKLIEMELALPRADQWDQDPEWRRIGQGEALYMQRHYTEAMAVEQSLENDSRKPNNHFTEQQRIGVLWLKGLILFDTTHYKNAVPYLRAVADKPSFHHSKDAFYPLFLSLLLSRDETGAAEDVYGEYLRRYGPGGDGRSMARLLFRTTRVESAALRRPQGQPSQ